MFFAIRRNGLFSFIPADILFGASPTLFLDDFWENLYNPIALIERLCPKSTSLIIRPVPASGSHESPVCKHQNGDISKRFQA
ncbi:hypothetical protein [Sutterella wadsworthensis]|uniref:hypothetical protein n=1 Tax=Sutterella wadsworthensis TaxID=40545 RepID=UPI0013F68836|nr:hypothetical protein [Sutterella wadsworthensis]